MGDLILQGFRDVPKKRLVKILSEEKRRMFGEQKLLVKKEGGRSLMLKGIYPYFRQLKKRTGFRVGKKEEKDTLEGEI
jgi:hypothetical protein